MLKVDTIDKLWSRTTKTERGVNSVNGYISKVLDSAFL
jgi:hypothetical protein